MPLLKRQPFVKAKPPGNLKADDEVFHCKLTNEIFADYEKFFERIILCNSLVWSCSITGKSSLTYQEALEAEAKARKQLAGFPEYFAKPILYLASLTQRSRLNDANDDIFLFCKDRYFASEVVDVVHQNERKVCTIVKVMPPEDRKVPANGKVSDNESDVICLDSDTDEEDKPLSRVKSEAQIKDDTYGPDPTKFQYVVQEFGEPNIYIVSALQISRKKGLFTREKCKLYLKLHCSAEEEGIWKVKERYMKKFGIRGLEFEDLFDGPKPSFTVSKGKGKRRHSSKGNISGVIDLTGDEVSRAKSERRERKKWEKEEKKRMKKEEKKAKKKKEKPKPQAVVEKPKMTVEDFAALREKMRLEKLAKKEELKKKWEDEKQRRKEERDKERKKKKVPTATLR